MVLLGKTDIGGTPNEWGAGDYKAAAGPHTLASQDTFNRIKIYMRASSGTIKARAFIYADSAGDPSSLEALSNEVIVSTTVGWWEFTISSTVLSAGDYWIGLIFDGKWYYYHDGASNHKYNIDTYADGPTDPFGVPGETSKLFSGYAYISLADDSQNLLAEFIVRHPDNEELPGKFIIPHSDLVELSAELISRQVSSAVLFGEFKVRQDSATEFVGEFTARHTDSAELLSEFIIRYSDSEELSAEFESGQGWENLLAEFISRHDDSEELLGYFKGQDSEDLPGEFEAGQGSVDLLGIFVVRRDSSAELLGYFEGQDSEDFPGEFIARQIGSADLPAEFVVAQWQEDLPSEFIVRHSASMELHGSFDSQGVFNLPAEFSAIRSYGRLLPAEFVVPRGTEDLLGEFISRLIGSQPLLGIFNIVHSIALVAGFEVRHIASAELLGKFVVRHTVAVPPDLPAEFSVTNMDGNNLPCEFSVQHTFTGEGVIISEDPWDLLNVKKGIGTGFLEKPMIGQADGEHKVFGASSYRFQIAYQRNRHDYIVVGYAPETWMQHEKAEQIYSKYSLCPDFVIIQLDLNWFVSSLVTSESLCTMAYEVLVSPLSANINLCTLNREAMALPLVSTYNLATAVT